VRSGTSDLWVATETLAPAFHLPGPEVDRDAARLVWDLGANVGITTAHLAIRMPRAEVVAVELDAANAGVARRNLSGHGGRCRVVEAGVWTHDGRLRYGGDAGQEVGFRVGGGDRSAEALSLDTLLARGGGGPVDYVKMDLEGAEREVLRHATGWAAHVRAIRVEVHEPYTVAECQADLRALGFAVSVPALPDGYDGMQPVVGVRG
jgi:FkbM family methyltransferase